MGQLGMIQKDSEYYKLQCLLCIEATKLLALKVEQKKVKSSDFDNINSIIAKKIEILFGFKMDLSSMKLDIEKRHVSFKYISDSFAIIIMLLQAEQITYILEGHNKLKEILL